ncbi:GNAT family N-acetyltransferase [soil metagenome]|nr:N-acetyltransferase [Chthoniobacterales bacterium]
MTIRDAAEADLPAIVEIFNATVPTRMSTAVLEPVSVEERRVWFHEHSPDRHPLWVLEIDRAIAGWLSFHSFITRCAYRGTVEVSVYVHDGFRRRGVARALIQKGLAECPRLEITTLVGLIMGHNSASLELFERLGFERWGVLPRVTRLDGVDRDIVIVGRHIAAPPASEAVSS